MLRSSGSRRRHQIHIRCRGMHLNREHFVAIEKLEQQRKMREKAGLFAHQFGRELLPQITKRPPSKRPIGNVTHVVIAVTEYPRFANRTITRQWLAEQVG